MKIEENNLFNYHYLSLMNKKKNKTKERKIFKKNIEKKKNIFRERFKRKQKNILQHITHLKLPSKTMCKFAKKTLSKKYCTYCTKKRICEGINESKILSLMKQ